MKRETQIAIYRVRVSDSDQMIRENAGLFLLDTTNAAKERFKERFGDRLLYSFFCLLFASRGAS